MEQRTDVLKHYLLNMLPRTHVQRICETLEPYFQMMERGKLEIDKALLHQFTSAEPAHGADNAHEDLSQALRHGLLQPLFASCRNGEHRLLNETERKLSTFLLNWLIQECENQDHSHVMELRQRVLAVSSPSS